MDVDTTLFRALARLRGLQGGVTLLCLAPAVFWPPQDFLAFAAAGWGTGAAAASLVA